VESQNERFHQENFDVDGRIILKWILDRLVGAVWTGFIWPRIGIYGRLL
jgi:hypothetical protein